MKHFVKIIGILTFCFTIHLMHANTIAQQLFHLAQNCQKENNTDSAIKYYRQAFLIDPHYFDAAVEVAHLLYNAEKTEDAIFFYTKAISLQSHYAELHYNLGLCYIRINQLDNAKNQFQEAIQHNPHYIKAYVQLAHIYSNKKEYNQAIEIYTKALLENSQSSELYHHLARALRSIEQYDKAIEMFEKAIALDASNQFILLDLANTLHMVDDYERALVLYKQVLTIDPNNNEALYNLGYTYKKCGNANIIRHYTEQALEIHNKVLQNRPDYALAHFSRSLSHLTLGNFDLGWPEYEWRWAAYDETPKQFTQPTWTGQDLYGKRILIYAEQGFGDTFQFVRYGQVLKQRGAFVIMQTQHQLKQIITQCPYFDVVVSDREVLPDFDYHIPLMSIPMVVKTSIDTVPHEIPYLYAKEALIEQWKQKIAHDHSFKIGICWQGNKGYRNLFLKKEVASKAMRLATFGPLAQIPQVTLYSLQKVNGTEQLQEVNQSMQIITFDHFDEDEGPFMDTAALIRNLNLVITVDTSIAHLAAGLGVEVWVLLPFPADWRWMLDCTDTPWYPNMRLFRQQERGDWQSVMQDVVTALHEKLSLTKPVSTKQTNPDKKIIHPPLIMNMPSVSSIFAAEAAHDVQSVIAEHIASHKTCMEQSDELKQLTQQLLIVNKQLWQLERNMPQNKSIFDEDFMKHMQEACTVHALKKILVHNINEVTQLLKSA